MKTQLREPSGKKKVKLPKVEKMGMRRQLTIEQLHMVIFLRFGSLDDNSK
jgi:hypothetical protein